MELQNFTAWQVRYDNELRDMVINVLHKCVHPNLHQYINDYVNGMSGPDNAEAQYDQASVVGDFVCFCMVSGKI